MGVPTSEVSYTLATTGMGDHEVHKGHVKKKCCNNSLWISAGYNVVASTFFTKPHWQIQELMNSVKVKYWYHNSQSSGI
jgi:predicted ATP-dependent Lon-type protease